MKDLFVHFQKDYEKIDTAQKWVTKIQYPNNDLNTTMTSFGAILLTDTGKPINTCYKNYITFIIRMLKFRYF